MLSQDASLVMLIAATSLHLGFQLVVTAVVYPALARVPAHDWAPAHDAHGRSIVGIVGVLYAALLGAIIWAPLTHPGNVWVWIAVAGASLSMATTAIVAGPTHARLDNNKDAALIRRLLICDRVRTLGAVMSFGGAAAAVLP